MRTTLLTRDGIHFRPEYIEQTSKLSASKIKETEKAVFVSIEMPGVEESTLDLSVEDHKLLVNAVKTDIFTSESKEISRTLSLSKDIDTEKIEANLKDGILYLVFPKIEKPSPKKIELSKVSNFEKLLQS